MPARRCSTCAISYPQAVIKCHVCEGDVDLLGNAEPDADWQDAVHAARLKREEAGVFRTTDDQVTQWRCEEFVRYGLDADRAEHFAPLRIPETGGWLVDLNRFRELVANGCVPVVAIDILV